MSRAAHAQGRRRHSSSSHVFRRDAGPLTARTCGGARIFPPDHCRAVGRNRERGQGVLAQPARPPLPTLPFPILTTHFLSSRSTSPSCFCGPVVDLSPFFLCWRRRRSGGWIRLGDDGAQRRWADPPPRRQDTTVVGGWWICLCNDGCNCSGQIRCSDDGMQRPWAWVWR